MSDNLMIPSRAPAFGPPRDASRRQKPPARNAGRPRSRAGVSAVFMALVAERRPESGTRATATATGRARLSR